MKLSFDLFTPTLQNFLICLSLVWFESAPAEADDAPATKVATFGQSIVVEIGEQPRIDTPVSIAIKTAEPGDPRTVRLVEITGGKETPIPSQIEPGVTSRLWWIMQGETPARSKRSFRIDQGTAVPSSELTIDKRPAFLEVHHGESPVLRYNMAHIEPPQGLNP
ncbi:MAG: hypothetical protein JWM11_7979, partial [Planctomycetaceae bacterium]|nr:hypothetical protein [Planctomycetaceae bacterium]